MRLIGYVDGVEVSFSFSPPNIYKAEIPRHFNGVYIIELKAIDDAGNETNYSRIHVKIDFTSMEFKILGSFESSDSGTAYSSKEMETSVYAASELDGFGFVDYSSEYEAIEVYQ